MSLEDRVTALTESIDRLVSVLANLPVIIPGEPAPGGIKDWKPADIKPADIKPADIKPADIKPADIKPEAKPEATKVLTYDADVRAPFLALLNSKRPKAMAILEALGVTNLKGFESKPETFADLSQRISEAQNG